MTAPPNVIPFVAPPPVATKCHKCHREIPARSTYCPVRLPSGETVAVHPSCMDRGQK